MALRERRGLRGVTPRPVRLAASRWLAHRASARLERDLAAMVARGGPIVAGPWLGEVGFELLYWVPFLAWFAERFAVRPERILVLSRGGTGSWYGAFAGSYADVFDQVTPAVFRDRHDTRVLQLGEQKQTQVTEFDRELVATAVARSGIGNWSLLHPSRMYELLNPFWWGHLPSTWVHRHARYRRLLPPEAETGDVPLPAICGRGATRGEAGRYVAVKFYFNDCFPASDVNREFVGSTLRTLTARGPVVALSTGLDIDDHDGARVDEFGVHHLQEGLSPARNLAVQSAVVAGASAFVGTYGGFSYLAPFHGVSSRAYYSNPAGFSQKHLQVAREAFALAGAANLLDVRDAAAGVEP